MNDMFELKVLNEKDRMCKLQDRSADNPEVVPAPQDIAEMRELGRFLENHSAPAVLIESGGEHTPLPTAVHEVLRQAVFVMENGASVSVERVDPRLTTQQAANLLGVSRSTLVRLLDEHELPFERLGEFRHRRFPLQDVLAYRERKRVDRQARLDELTRQAAEDDLYDVDATSYRQASSDERKR